jgi:DNA polymerase III subunit delta
MGISTRQELWKSLESGQLDSVYTLFGPETYLRDAASSKITERVLEGVALREFNDSDYSLVNTDIEKVIASASELPAMAQRRVVRLRDFGKIKEQDEASLIRYITRPVESTVLILISDDLDKRKRLTKVLLDKTTAVEFLPLNEKELLAWVKARIKALNLRADDRCLSYLIGLTGNNLLILSVEIEKLASASLPDNTLTMELVDLLTPFSREMSNFELTDHLISNDRPAALRTLYRLLDGGAEPVALLGLIGSSYRRMALAKALMVKGAPPNEVFRVVGLPYSKREEFLATARRSSSSMFSKAIERIAATDLAIKTSQGTPRLQLELLVLELCRN